MEIRSLRPGDREAVLGLLREAFGPDPESWFDAPPPLGPDRTLIAVDGGPIGCVQTFTRPVRLRRTGITLGGISGLTVRPDRRGQGCGAALVGAACEALRDAGHPLGLLFTDAFAFYEGLGWRQLSRRLFRLRPRGAAAVEGTARRPFTESDQDAVRRIFEAYTATLSGVTVRDAGYWKALRDALDARGCRLRVAERDGAPVAYVWSERREGRVAVLEYARERGAASELVDLLLDELEGQERLRAPIVPDPELGHALRERGCAPDPGEDPTPMWSALDATRLAEIAGLPPDVSQRALLDALVGGPSATFFESDRF